MRGCLFLIKSAVCLYLVCLQVYTAYFPDKAAQEVNLSMVWCALAVGFSYKILMSLTGLYFEGEEAGERCGICLLSLLKICLHFE